MRVSETALQRHIRGVKLHPILTGGRERGEEADLRIGEPGIRTCFVLAALFIGCGGGSPGNDSRGGEWQAVVDTIADTIHVRTTSGRVWPSDGHLASEVAIGELDGRAEYEFGQVLALAVDSTGRIYVLDGHGPVVRSYATDGSYLRDIGREGEGPGEYKRPDGGLAFLPGDRLVVRDPGNARLIVYSADGEYLEDWPLAGGGAVMSGSMVVTESGALLTPVIKDWDAEDLETGMARYDPSGGIDTLDLPDLGHEPLILVSQSDDAYLEASVPFSPEQKTVYSPLGYFVTGVNDQYSFKLLRTEEPPVKISIDRPPVPVASEEATILRERVTERFQRSLPGWRWDGPAIPATKPAYDRLLVSEDGRVWVQVSQPSQRTMTEAEQRAQEETLGRPVNPYEEPVVFDVFEPSGEFMGRNRDTRWLPDASDSGDPRSYRLGGRDRRSGRPTRPSVSGRIRGR